MTLPLPSDTLAFDEMSDEDLDALVVSFFDLADIAEINLDALEQPATVIVAERFL